MALPSTADRVPRHTAPKVNERIRRQTEENVARYRNAPPEEVGRRLDELAREWDIERAIEANAAALALFGKERLALLAATRRRGGSRARP
jgi:hypothetical protein